MRTALLLCVCLLATAAETVSQPAPVYTEVMIENPVARAVLSTERAHLVRLDLKDNHLIRLPKHLASADQVAGAELSVLRPFQAKGAHNWLLNHDAAAGGLDGQDTAPWTVASTKPGEAVFAYVKPGRWRYQLTYRMHESRPTVGVEMTITNLGSAAATIAPLLLPLNGVHQDYGPGEAYYCSVFEHVGGPAGSLTNNSLPTPGPSLTPVTDSSKGVDFVGLKSRFFAAWWSPLAPAVAGLPALEATAAAPAAGSGPQLPSAPIQAAGPERIAALPAGAWTASSFPFKGRQEDMQACLLIAFAASEVKAGETWQRGWSLSGSGMTKAELARFGEAERSIEFTDGFYRFFKILAKGLTWVLDLIYGLVRHYGIAVILLTMLIKGALYRTTFKQQESMLKMQKIGPELKYVQEQYKNNKQMLAQKQMELFKKHGVNPLGGCLPILIQLPIFIALFQAFSHSADLRGTSFLWIPDLTLPDQIWGTPISWLGGWVFSINPLPIIYIGVSAWMSFSQKPPANSDPQQEMMYKMMRWMPVMFGFIFYNMPSGLVLYFTVQAVISTLEIKYIKRKLGMG